MPNDSADRTQREAAKGAGEDPSVRVIVITGGIPGIFIRHYDVGELSDAAEAIQGGAPRAPVWTHAQA